MAKLPLKAWLKDNPLTQDPKDMTAIVSSNGTLTEDDLLDEIVEEGIELKRDTLKSVVTRYKIKVMDKVLSGCNVNIGLVYLRPVIKGPFYNKTWNPAVNSVQVNIIQGAALRTAIAAATVEILGERADMIELYTIADSTTGSMDGVLTKGRNAELKGSYIKIAGDSSVNGITFRNMTTQMETRLATTDIVLNEPSRLLILVPATLEAGEYELMVTTQFTGSNKLLKQPRSATLNLPVIVS